MAEGHAAGLASQWAATEMDDIGFEIAGAVLDHESALFGLSIPTEYIE